MTDLALSQQLNQQLNQWKSRVDTITNNIMDLYGAESSNVIRARLHDAANGFTGVTQAKAVRAIEVQEDLVELYTRLTAVMDEAFSLKGDLRKNKNQERVNELLNGQSILTRTQHVLVRNRRLLDDGDREVRSTPSDVLATMEQSFAEARDAVTAIADAMAHVEPRLSALGQKIATLESWAKRLGVSKPASLSNTSRLIARVKSDPLGCAAELNQIETAVAQWRAELEAIDAEYKAVLASFARGKAAFAELCDVVARSDATYAEAREKIADSAGLAPPLDGEAVESLGAWLRTLEQNATAGRLAAVKVGMAKWEQTCSDHLAAARANDAHNSAAIDERAELRGRYTALCAKADALRRRGMALGDTAEMARSRGRDVLDVIPFDLDAGRRAVDAFAAALAAASK